MMSKEHRLTVGKNAMRRVYELFENHLYSTYLCILGDLFSRGVVGEKLIHRIKHTSDPDQALHLLLDHLCEQDLENLLILVEVLHHSGKQQCLPEHTLLAERLEYHIADFDKDAEVTTETSHLARNQSLRDSVKREPSDSSSHFAPCRAKFKPTSLPSTLPAKLQSQTVCEYPELVTSLLYFFDDKLEDDESIKPACRDSKTQTQGKCGNPYHRMPLITFTGPLNSRTHEDLVILLWKLSGSNATRSKLAYQLIQGKKQLPIDLQIINVLGAVYATSDNAHLFQEALEWTKRPDCLNPVHLQCRLNYLLSLCTLSSDKALSEQYLKQAYELSAMCEPDYTTALLMMQEARMTLSRIEEGRSQLSEEGLEQVSAISNRACEISRTLSEWMQPFAMVVRLLKMQLDARVALLLFKSGNHMGAIVVVMPLSMLVNEMEEPETFSQLLPRQQAVYHYIKTAVFVIHKNREAAMSSAVKGRDLFLKVNWFEPAHRIMEIVNDFN